MNEFQDSLDIANKGLGYLGQPPIEDISEDSQRNLVMSGLYDKVRQGELRAHVWRFAKRRVFVRPITATSRLLVGKPWQINETYSPGSIVSDADGRVWVSWTPENYGNEPGVSAVWDTYIGPAAVDEWVSTISYFAGEVVYKKATYDGSFALFMSLQGSNTDNPDTSTPWSATATYGLDDRVSSGGSNWRSLITFNRNVTPADVPNAWSVGVTYATSATALARDGFVYIAGVGVPVGLDPVLDDGSFWTRSVVGGWSRVPTAYTASGKWLPLYSNMINMPLDYLTLGPRFTDPTLQSNGQGVFRTPYGYLRNSRPSTGGRPVTRDDHDPVGDWILSNDGIILLEFCADIRNVKVMDALFCNAFAARLAFDACIPLTQDKSLLADISAEYNKFMGQAATVNGIEVGPQEPDEDDLISCRA